MLKQEKKVICSVKKNKNKQAFISLLLHFPFFDFFCFPLNCDICNRGEDWIAKCEYFFTAKSVQENAHSFNREKM